MAVRIALIVSALAGFFLLSDTHRGAYDFQAFYCAGKALRSHANPYLTEPLRTCEHAQTDGTYAALPPNVALPAPQPPYDLLLFAPFSLLPFALAKAAWGALLGVASAAAVIGLAKVARVSFPLAFMALAASLLLPSFAFGQLFPLYAAACVLAALFAQREQWALCGIAAAASLVEPHLGLGVCAAVGLCNARARAFALACVLLLAAASITAVGWHTCVQYASVVLHLHALSEMSSDAQLGLSAIVRAFGASQAQALAAGELSYAVMLLLGVWLGRVLADRFNERGFIVAVPAAFALAGGTFIHATEMFAGILLALLFVNVPRYRAGAIAALLLLSVPWFTLLDGGMPLAFAGLASAVVFFEVWELCGKKIVLPALVCVCACAALLAASARSPYAAVHTPGIASIPASAVYPQASWQALTQATLATNDPITWALRLPSWAGLAILVCIVAAYAPPEKRLTVNVN